MVETGWHRCRWDGWKMHGSMCWTKQWNEMCDSLVQREVGKCVRDGMALRAGTTEPPVHLTPEDLAGTYLLAASLDLPKASATFAFHFCPIQRQFPRISRKNQPTSPLALAYMPVCSQSRKDAGLARAIHRSHPIHTPNDAPDGGWQYQAQRGAHIKSRKKEARMLLCVVRFFLNFSVCAAPSRTREWLESVAEDSHDGNALLNCMGCF